MTRSAARRTSAVQVDKSPPPAPPDSGRGLDDPLAPSQTASSVPWYWRFALFVWGVSFMALLVYELLTGLIRAW
ncbi:MAG: hypothetical protein ACRELF_23695 [Gemmataceae bacterium]